MNIFFFFVFSTSILAGEIPDWAQNINKQVKSWVDSESVLGAELLIIQNGRTIIHEAWGWDDRDNQIPLRKGQLFRIHSMTKPLTGTAVLMLEERGIIDLNDKVSTYLKSYDNDKCRDISIKQLLNHTAGFTQPAYPKGSIDLYSSLEEAVEDLADKGPKYTPGTEYHYSDGHSATLGLLVTKLSGMPVEEFISREIFAPMGMNNSFCKLSGEKPDREKVCDTYLWREGKYTKLWDNHDEEETPFFRASGGVATTIEDYASFISMWMNKGMHNNKRILKEEIVLRALKKQDINPDYGFHWEIHHYPGVKGELPVFGHSGSSGTVAIAIPEYNAQVYYFTQSRGTLTANFIPSIVLEEMGYKEKLDFPDINISEELRKTFAGEYLVGKETWELEAKEDKLIFKSGRLVPIEFIPVSQYEFVNRFMDMKLEFNEKFTEQPEFIFSVQGTQLTIKKQ